LALRADTAHFDLVSYWLVPSGTGYLIEPPLNGRIFD
jgi:hypothetical protein